MNIFAHEAFLRLTLYCKAGEERDRSTYFQGSLKKVKILRRQVSYVSFEHWDLN